MVDSTKAVRSLNWQQCFPNSCIRFFYFQPSIEYISAVYVDSFNVQGIYLATFYNDQISVSYFGHA